MGRLYAGLILGLMLASAAVLAGTIDVVHTRSSGEIRGEIIEETDAHVIVAWIDPVLNLPGQRIIPREDIIQIDRDVEVDDSEVVGEDDQTSPNELRGTAPADSGTANTGRFGDRVQAQSGEGREKMYVVPLFGQVGTDILPSVYEPILEDIKAKQPDTIVFRIKSHDQKDIDHESVDIMEGKGMPERPDMSSPELKKMIELREMFLDDDFKDMRQVVWVEDAYSTASLLALAWEDVYISENADFGNAGVVWAMWAAPVLSDKDKYGKYLDAVFGDVEGLVTYGGWQHPEKLPFIEALVIPERVLSTDWMGREAKWYDNLSGFPVDSTRSYDLGGTVNLTGRLAEELMVTDGLAESLDDLAILLDVRRYDLVGDAEPVVQAHRTKWRSEAKRARECVRTWQEKQGGPLYQMRVALTALKRYLTLIRTNEAVRMRMRMEGLPTDETQLEILIEQLEERIAAAARGRGGGGGGNGGGFGGGGGGFGG